MNTIKQVLLLPAAILTLIVIQLLEFCFNCEIDLDVLEGNRRRAIIAKDDIAYIFYKDIDAKCYKIYEQTDHHHKYCGSYNLDSVGKIASKFIILNETI